MKNEKIIVDRLGECPLCHEYGLLEFGHKSYEPDNSKTGNDGRFICHRCNTNERGISPEMSSKEHKRIAIRDYSRRNIVTQGISLFCVNNMEVQVIVTYNHQTGVYTECYNNIRANNGKKIFNIDEVVK